MTQSDRTQICTTAALILIGSLMRAPSVRADTFSYITDDSPSPAIQLARDELATYLERMALRKLTVRTADGTVTPSRLIICPLDSPRVRELKPALPALPAEGFVIALREKQVYLAGADERAALYAVYKFLDRLGCRWLAPALSFYDGHHEHVPQMAEQTLDLSQDIVGQPTLKFRKLYVEEGHSHNAENLAQIIAWMPKLRFNTLVIPIDYQGGGRVRWDNWRAALTPELARRGIHIEVGGHGYQNFLNAEMEGGILFRDHPDWFAQAPDGKRSPHPNYVPCTSNPQAVERLQQNVITYLKAHPEIEIFDFWPPDGARWCTCATCQTMGTPSTRHALLVNQMAESLQKALPQVRIECIAYSSYLDPPEKVTLDPKVLVDFCPIAQCFESQIDDPASKANAGYVRAFEAWQKAFTGDISIYSYYRKYAWDSLPNLIPHYMQNDLRYYRKAGAVGVSTYAEPGDWFTYELNHYVLGRLAWNPDEDVDALIHSFCSARYGPEAALAEATVTQLEGVVRHGCNLPGTSLKEPTAYDGYLGVINNLQNKTTAARTKHHDDSALDANLRRLSLMLEYAARDLRLQQHRAASKPNAERRQMLDDLAAFLRRHEREGVFIWLPRLEPAKLYPRFGVTQN